MNGMEEMKESVDFQGSDLSCAESRMPIAFDEAIEHALL